MKAFLCLWSLLLIATANAFVSHASKGARGVSSSQHSFGDSIRLTGSSNTALYATKKKASKKKVAAKAETKKKVAPENFKKAEFVTALAERTGLTKKDADQSLQSVLDIITEQVGEGKKIAFPGFGSFILKDRAERKGRNPQTGADLIIPASKSPTFSASKTWKDVINGKK
mmetsp:Transcript_2618/g.3494  ORF Transcript_2618/g.3494 Transcript_2618/m.3494 type:complete len:171 (+) Transcript_2618:144-656(+)|eukprot:CAMPEP_0198136686 /NCGR_PEP_ID=MMETSP1443-20131203/310_1 /TAXON_ID=186043 /ORGANISM="Entomoneis sp., Strain CCMP2396" /LENGTH=170 /DNA_ID=CAMNT_0043797945 /DNA_START=102 /DNA_END=614 /DNA_ORIENTATION=-